jgi:hypothetical protein
MSDRIFGGKRRLMATTIACFLAIWAAELYNHLHLRPVALPTLLFELLEVVLLVGCATTCILLILRIRIWDMAAAAAAMVAILLVGEAFVGVKPVTPSVLLVELLETALLVGSSIAVGLLLRARR